MLFDAITTAQIAMNQDQYRLQLSAQNISNMQTPGYKRQVLGTDSFDHVLQGNITDATVSMMNAEMNQQGALNQTHRNLDLAISGDGYFEVEKDNQRYFTRRGDCHLNEQGELLNASGAHMRGQQGIIRLDSDNFTIDKQGKIYVDHHVVDQLAVMHFASAQELKYSGNGLYSSLESPQMNTNNSQILQGFIEQANVSSVDEMTSMMRSSRHLEASQRILRTANNMMSAAIHDLGDSNA